MFFFYLLFKKQIGVIGATVAVAVAIAQAK